MSRCTVAAAARPVEPRPRQNTTAFIFFSPIKIRDGFAWVNKNCATVTRVGLKKGRGFIGPCALLPRLTIARAHLGHPRDSTTSFVGLIESFAYSELSFFFWLSRECYKSFVCHETTSHAVRGNAIGRSDGGGGGGGIEEWEILVWNSGEMERFLLPLSQTRRLKYASCVFERGEPLSLLLLLHLRNTLTMGNDVYARDGWLAKRESALSSTTFRGLSKPKLCLERETSKELKANEFSWERLDQNVSPLYRCQSPKTILRSHCRLVIVENIRAIGSKFWSIIYQVLFSCIKFTRRGFVVVARDWVTRDSRERVRTDTIFDSTTRTTLIALRGRINEHL